MKKKTKQYKKAILKKKKVVKLTAKDFVSTGSTLLNLACTGFPDRGFAKGYYYFIVGDSESGKTWLALTCLAEASINKNFAVQFTPQKKTMVHTLKARIRT